MKTEGNFRQKRYGKIFMLIKSVIPSRILSILAINLIYKLLILYKIKLNRYKIRILFNS